MKMKIAAGAAAATLALPAAAGAHVTLQPDEAPAGGFIRLDVRVPNERDDAGTTKVDVQLPPGFASVSYEPVPGWDVKVTKRTHVAADAARGTGTLDRPIEQHGEQITEEVGRITWTGDGKTGVIRPGEFQDFGLSVGTPDKPGHKLTFKALQTYDNGEVVRWIGPPDADEPAPQVELTADEVGEGGSAGTTGATAGADEGGSAGAEDGGLAGDQAGASTDGDDAPVWLAVVALAVGALGLLAGIGGLMAGRRRVI